MAKNQPQEANINDIVWNYNPVNPETSYDRVRYLGSQDQLNKLEEYTGKLQKDPNDPKTRGKLTDLLFRDKKLGATMPIEQLRLMAKNAYDNGSNEMAKYVRHNLDDFFDKDILTDEGMQHLVLSDQTPLYPTGNKKHDEIVNAIFEFKVLKSIHKEQDTGKMGEYIQSKLKKDKAPEWVARTVDALRSDPGFTQKIFLRYLGASNQILAQKIYTKDGKPNRKLLENLVRDSIKLAEDKLEDETDEGKKADIWDDDLKPILYAVAQEPFEYVKDKWERDEIGDIRKREDERHARKMKA